MPGVSRSTPRHRRLAGEAAVDQDVRRARVLADRGAGGRELLFVVGRLADAGAEDQARVGVHPGLRVVALLEAVLGRHDAALLVGEVDLVLLAGPGRGRLGRTAARLLALGLARLAAGELFGMLGLLGHEAGVGAGLDLDLGPGQLRFALRPALDFVGDQ